MRDPFFAATHAYDANSQRAVRFAIILVKRTLPCVRCLIGIVGRIETGRLGWRRANQGELRGGIATRTLFFLLFFLFLIRCHGESNRGFRDDPCLITPRRTPLSNLISLTSNRIPSTQGAPGFPNPLYRIIESGHENDASCEISERTH